MAHTWYFYLTLGRTWGGPRVSGATITAYSTSGGSTVLTGLTTNNSGYTTFTTSGVPSSYYWRVALTDGVLGPMFNGTQCVVLGDSGGAYNNPNASWNTTGVSIISPSYNSNNSSTNYSRTLYLYVVGTNLSWGNKQLSRWDFESLLPPTKKRYSSGYTAGNGLIYHDTRSSLESYLNTTYFYQTQVSQIDSSVLVPASAVTPYTTFITGSTAGLTCSPTSLGFTYSAGGSSSYSAVTGTCNTAFYPSVTITGTSKSYFSAGTYSVSDTGGVYTYNVRVWPTNTNYTGSNRTATLVISYNKETANSWFGGTVSDVKVTLTQGYYISSGTSGSTSGGGTTT